MEKYIGIGMVIGIFLSAVVFGLLGRRDDEKHNEIIDFYETRIKMLNRDISMWRSKYSMAKRESNQYGGIVKAYEAIMPDFIKEKRGPTDSIFMFENVVYKPISFTLSRDFGERDILSVEFVKYSIGNEYDVKENKDGG